jgi:hypothetical protein
MAQTKTDFRGERVGLFAMDPGTTTGVAYCEDPVLLDGSVKEIFDRTPLIVEEYICPIADDGTNELDGARVLAELFSDLQAGWTLAGIPYNMQFFVYEDFILRAGKDHSSVRSGLSPVRITAHIQGMLVNSKNVWVPQSPGDAKNVWTNERLRRADLWTRGLEHGRDATRHAALWAKRILS